MSANIATNTEIGKAYVDYAASVIVKRSEQTITSLQVAEVTGRQHSNVMRDIRNLVEQVEDINQFNFELVEYTDKKGESRPCYNLTKKDCLLLASGYDANLRAKIINRWELLEMEKAVAAPSNSQLQYVQTQLYLADALADRLRMNEASRLGMYQSIAEPYRLSLPLYVPSQGVMKSARELLKEIGSDMSAIRFSQLLVEHGYLETLTRPTAVKTVVKRFKSITEKGKPYGENVVSPKNQNETQPHWYADRFRDLYGLVTA